MNKEIINGLKQRAEEMLKNDYSRKIGDEEIYTIICEWEKTLDLYNKEKEKTRIMKAEFERIENIEDDTAQLKLLLKEEKEKNKKLEIELEIKKYCKVDELTRDLIYYKNLAKEYQGNCISKDKIKEKIKHYEEAYENNCNGWESEYQFAVKVLKELLEK